MNSNYRQNERELVKVATFFKRQSRKLIDAGRLGPEHEEVSAAVDRFIEQMNAHADHRALILQQRETLKKLVKDNASCPRCYTGDKLKAVGTEKDEKGWKYNRYRCRKCNIEFTWNRPNNPWDLIRFMEELVSSMRARQAESQVEEEKQNLAAVIESMEANLGKLKPVIDAHDTEYDAVIKRDSEMDRLIHEMKNSLMIERIKMDTWENRQASLTGDDVP